MMELWAAGLPSGRRQHMAEMCDRTEVVTREAGKGYFVGRPEQTQVSSKSNRWFWKVAQLLKISLGKEDRGNSDI